MKIRMYECCFGDCFRLVKKGHKDLFVDFGIHEYTCSKSEREKRFNNIINDMGDEKDQKEFLLTHYHSDHFNGVLHMVKYSKHKFSDVYIPDIWNIEYSVHAFALLLFKDVLNNDKIENNLTIIDFLESICTTNGNIHFVKRGSIFHDKQFIVLWPTQDFIDKKIKHLYDDLAEKFGGNLNKINELAYRLIEIMSNYQKQTEQNHTSLLNEVKEDFLLLKTEFDSKYSTNQSKNISRKLNELGNQISIVFQNYTKDRNVLFTGDFGMKRNWNYIEKNKDGNVNMHNEYEVIKVPHHVTKRYYHSFYGKTNECSTLMIPNGNNRKSWCIDTQYVSDSHSLKYKTICGCSNKCSVPMCVNCRNIKKYSFLDI